MVKINKRFSAKNILMYSFAVFLVIAISYSLVNSDYHSVASLMKKIMLGFSASGAVSKVGLGFLVGNKGTNQNQRAIAGTMTAQSAMEYLMTYGWAILIIAVVLGALFSLGVFSGSSLLGTSCVASPGFLCSAVNLGTSGTMNFNFGQNTGTTIYNIEIACTATTNSLGLPSNSLAWNFVYANGVVTNTINNANLNNAIDLSADQAVAISGIQCYGQTGAALTSPPIGTPFSGFIILNFTTTACNAVPCPWYTARVATITVKAT